MKIFFIISLIFLSSCSKTLDKAGNYFPQTPFSSSEKKLNTMIAKKGTPEFQQGWHDGCDVGSSAGGNAFYKMFYNSNTVDGYKMASSLDYKNAWTYAFWYCYRYVYIKDKSAIWNSVFSGYQ